MNMLAKLKSIFSRPKTRRIPPQDEMIATAWLEKRDTELKAAQEKADRALESMFKAKRKPAPAAGSKNKLMEGVAAGMAISNLNEQ
jgi:hypothetical protein